MIITLSTLFKNIDIDKENLADINIDNAILENIGTNKEILESINIYISINKDILENIYIDIDKGIIENIYTDVWISIRIFWVKRRSEACDVSPVALFIIQNMKITFIRYKY